jgi:hypothetical protein
MLRSCHSLAVVSAAPQARTRSTVRHPAVHSPWLVGLLTLLSFGLYLPLWLAMTWAELHPRTTDRRQAVWHAVACSIPVFGAVRLHSHFALIRFLAGYWGLPTTVEPWDAVLAVLALSMGACCMWWLPQAGTPIRVLFLFLLAGWVAWIVARAQIALNAHWQASGRPRPLRNRASAGPQPSHRQAA